MLRKYLLSALLLLSVSAATTVFGQRQRLFQMQAGDTVPYRIPAITQCKNGDIIAVSDYRYCKSDIGYGPVDLHYRLSNDQGKTWGEEQVLADGTGDERSEMWRYAYGDCALIADRTSGEVLAVCVAGKTPYWAATRQNPNRVVRFRSYDNGHTWDAGRELTDHIYGLFDARQAGPVSSLFMGSGKIHQSRYVKIGKYYRLYAAFCTKIGNFVLYSDDFGENWKMLGNINRSCCPDGDEPKCEELPDGSVILSSRANGRMFNIFAFSDVKKGEGEWGVRAKAKAFADIQNACNGEIILLPARRMADKKRVWLALQSVPFGPQRKNVGFFYKELVTAYENAAQFAQGWVKGLQVSHDYSAYSTFTLQKNGKIGFLWEEGSTCDGAGYNIDYEPLTIEAITDGRYKFDKR